MVDELAAIGGGGCFSLDFCCSIGCLLLVRLIIFPDSFRLLLFVDMTTGMLRVGLREECVGDDDVLVARAKLGRGTLIT